MRETCSQQGTTLSMVTPTPASTSLHQVSIDSSVCVHIVIVVAVMLNSIIIRVLHSALVTGTGVSTVRAVYCLVYVASCHGAHVVCLHILLIDMFSDSSSIRTSSHYPPIT